MGKTPVWAHNTIAGIIIITGIVQYIISQDSTLDPAVAERICLYVNGIEMLAVAVLRFFGVSDENLSDNKDPNGKIDKFSDLS